MSSWLVIIWSQQMITTHYLHYSLDPLSPICLRLPTTGVTFHFFTPLFEPSPVDLQLSKEFYFPIKKTPKMVNEWIHNPFVNKPGQSTLSLFEDEKLVEIANDGDLWTMFGTASNLFAFWVSHSRISWHCHKSIESLSVSNYISSWGEIFCGDSYQNKAME